MKQRGSLSYLTKEGFHNIRSNKLMSFASISVLMSCLVLIGVAALLFVNVDAMIGNIESQNVIMVFVQDGATEEQIYQLGVEICDIKNVKECKFVSKDEAFAAQLESLGEAATLFDGLEDNPLPDAYEVTVADMTIFTETVTQLASLESVMNISENREFANQLNSIRTTSGYISLAIIIMLLIVSFFIISNTVKITMYNRRLEISIMKSVGATNWFIRWPFMIEGMVLGVLSGLLSLGMVYVIYRLGLKAIGTVLDLLSFSPVAFGKYAWLMLLAFVLTGVLTGALGSTFSMNKYLKEQDYDIIEN